MHSIYSNTLPLHLQFIKHIHIRYSLGFLLCILEELQEEHRIVIIQDLLVVQDVIIQIARRKHVNIQKKIVCSRNALNANISQYIKGINAIRHVVLVLALIDEGSDRIGWDNVDIEENGACLLKNELHQSTKLNLLDDKHRDNGSLPAFQQVGIAVDPIITIPKKLSTTATTTGELELLQCSSYREHLGFIEIGEITGCHCITRTLLGKAAILQQIELLIVGVLLVAHHLDKELLLVVEEEVYHFYT